MKPLLAPSILSADFSILGEQCVEASRYGADLLHIDVMDGHFVPNITYGPVVLRSLLGKEIAPFDVHLMIEDPDRHIESFMTENTKYITVHQEACVHLDRTLDHIRSLGASPGVSINPATPVSTLENVLEKVDLVLIMSVNPGFGGQKFIPYTLDKVRRLAELRERSGGEFRIEIDGGVNLDNLATILDSGVDTVVAGSAVFGGSSLSDSVSRFKDIMKKYGG